MNKLVFTFFALLLSVAVMAQKPEEVKAPKSENGARITFEQAEYNFGDIHQGEKAEYVFAFENTGNEPLILSNVMTTCGCTATDWPRDPIAPGESGKLKVVFNSAGKMGRQTKVVTIVSNAVNAQERVKMVGNVLPKKADTK